MEFIYEKTIEDELLELTDDDYYQQMVEMESATWVFKKGRKIIKKVPGEIKQKEINEKNKQMQDFWDSIPTIDVTQYDNKQEIELPNEYHGIYSIYPKTLMDEYMKLRLQANNIIKSQIITKGRTLDEQIKVDKYNNSYGKNEQYKKLDNEIRIFNIIKSLIKNNDNKDQLNKIANEIFEYFATPILVEFTNKYYEMNIKTKKGKEFNFHIANYLSGRQELHYDIMGRQYKININDFWDFGIVYKTFKESYLLYRTTSTGETFFAGYLDNNLKYQFGNMVIKSMARKYSRKTKNNPKKELLITEVVSMDNIDLDLYNRIESIDDYGTNEKLELKYKDFIKTLNEKERIILFTLFDECYAGKKLITQDALAIRCQCSRKCINETRKKLFIKLQKYIKDNNN
jgi:hypothetical protein